MGTPLMMAPEILEYKKYDEKCDIYSLGCTFFYMLYGKYPCE
jgi:serine/threonine protein kinase